MKLLHWSARGLVQLTFMFLAVVLVLALLDRLPSQVTRWKAEADRSRASLETLEKAPPKLRSTSEDAVRLGIDRLVVLRMAGEAELTRASVEIDRQQAEASKRILSNRQIVIEAARGNSDRVIASYRAEHVELPLLRQARALTRVRLQNLKGIRAAGRERADFNRRVLKYNADVAAYARSSIALSKREAQMKRRKRNQVCSSVQFWLVCDYAKEIAQEKDALANRARLLHSEKLKLEAYAKARRVFRRANEAVAVAKGLPDQALVALAKQTDAARTSSESSLLNRGWYSLVTHGQMAFLIVILAVFSPLAWRSFAFFVVAPAAARTKPLRLRCTGPACIADPSAVSVDVPIEAHSELLIRGNAHDRPTAGAAGDQWLLDWRIPVTCIAAGLHSLQRFRSEGRQYVTVGSGEGDQQEVALIEVPENGAVVIHPSAVKGVLKLRNQPLKIDRPIRLNQAISWLTFRFRFIVFHGPCVIIMQGRRGVRTKKAATSRAIDRRLVLGHDAALERGVTRTASFTGYVMGRNGLFDDSFAGQGIFIFQGELPRSKGGGILGRGIQGLKDALLNAFGI